MKAADRGLSTIFLVPLTQLVVAALLFLALLFGQREMAILTAVVSLFGLGVRLWTRISPLGVRCCSTVDKVRALPDERVTLSVTVENNKPVPVWLRLHIPFGTPAQSDSNPKALSKETRLPWFGRVQFHWELLPKRRGVHNVGPLRSFTGDIFDFSCSEAASESAHELLVYPKCVPLRSSPLPKLDFFGVPAPRSPVQDPVFILGTRDYQHWQPAKHIHWKASARHCRLQEKVFESTRHEKVLLVLDVDSFARNRAEEEFEETIEVVASMATRTDREGHSVGLVTNGSLVGGGSSVVPVGRSYRQLSAIMEVLARLRMRSERGILDVLRSSLSLTWGTSCVYFACSQDDAVGAARAYFSQRSATATCFVSRPPPDEQTPMAHSLDTLRVDRGER